MLSILLLALFTGWAAGALHHLFVGTVDGGSLYVLEMDDMARTLTMIRNNSAAGASPSIAFDVRFAQKLRCLSGRLLNHSSAQNSSSSAAARQMEQYHDTASRLTSP
jgi:tRNA(Met) C34 N-acetyltransferase TmcA